jgi:3-oxoacyl-[acyl-carrier protein] reductase
MGTGLAGKVALVTRGFRGVGAAIARRVAEAGADVAISCTLFKAVSTSP